MIDVGERLKELMEARGLNMHSLAKRSGLSWITALLPCKHTSQADMDASIPVWEELLSIDNTSSSC